MRKILVVLAIVIALARVSAQAQPTTSVIFYSEMFQGSITAVFGGAAGALVSGLVGVPIIFAICPYPCSSYADLRVIVTALELPIIAGIAAGAALGVANAGSQYGIEGNLWLAIVGALLGESVALATLLLPAPYNYFVIGIPVAAALGATLFYNWGAKMKSDKSKPAALSWSLPLVALRF